MRELLDGGPVVLGLGRNDDMKTLSSGRLQEGLEPKVLEPRSHLDSSVCKSAPRDLCVRVEVEDDAVRVLEIAVPGTPRVQFKDAHLGKTSQPLRCRQSYVRLQFAGLFVRHIDGLDPLRERRACVLLEEAGFGRALRTADQRNRSASNLRKHMRRDGPVVVGQLLLGQFRLRIDGLVGVGEADGSVESHRSALCRGLFCRAGRSNRMRRLFGA